MRLFGKELSELSCIRIVSHQVRCGQDPGHPSLSSHAHDVDIG